MPVIRLTDITSFLGPSLYGALPAIRATVALSSPDERFIDSLPESLIDALTGLLPGLGERLRDPRAETDCPIWAQEWMDTVRLTLAMAVEILRESGAAPRNIGVIEDEQGTHMVCACENPNVYSGALQLAVSLTNMFILGVDEEAELEERVSQAREGLNDFCEQAGPVNWTLDMQMIASEARARRIPFQLLMHYTVLLGQGRNRRIMMAKCTDRTTHFAHSLASNKALAVEMLRQHGLPVPTQRVVTTAEEARTAAEAIGYPVAVKPARGAKGEGVTADVRTDEALVRAFERARKLAPNVVVETFLQGHHHRFTVIGERIVCQAAMYPPMIVGDGRSTVLELVEKENRDPRRAANRSGIYSPIRITAESLDTLGNAGYTPESVPEDGEEVQVSSKSNTAGGGTWELVDVDEVHPDVTEAVLLAHKVIGLDISGVDFILPDVRRTWKNSGGGFCEVNPTPGVWGIPDVANRLFEFLFPPGTTARVPTAAILGSETGPQIAQMLAEVLRAADSTVGVSGGHGCYVNDFTITEDDASGAKYALQIQRDLRVDCVVLQTGVPQAVAEGFGFEICDVAAITDAVSERGDVERLLKELTGTLVVDAEDPRCPALIDDTPGAFLVTGDPSNAAVKRHVEAGGSAVTLEHDAPDAWVATWSAGERHRLFPLAASLDRPAVRAALFATAMAVRLNVDTAVLKTVLAGRPSPAAQV